MNTDIRETKELLLIADKLGSKLFDEQTRKTLSARPHRTVHRGEFFITNQLCYVPNIELRVRKYTIRRFEVTEHSVNFEIVGELNQYRTHQEASEAIRKLK